MPDLKKSQDNLVADYHRQRRMFCIYGGQLVVALQNSAQSHGEWFKEEGWISAEDDTFMRVGTRGVINPGGDVYFYTGYDFELTTVIEKEFFAHLQELVTQLELPLDTLIHGGAIKSAPGTKWPARKSYGAVMDYLR